MNSIVISGLLCLIVAANLVYQRFPKIPLRWAYPGLFLSLLVSFVVPLEKLFFESFVVRVGVSTIVLGLPVFFAGIIFVSSFAKANFRGSLLGSNLFGSLAVGTVLLSYGFFSERLDRAPLPWLQRGICIELRHPADPSLPGHLLLSAVAVVAGQAEFRPRIMGSAALACRGAQTMGGYPLVFQRQARLGKLLRAHGKCPLL
ncbi:MAG: hypothetical protein WCA20_04390 [Candidatus Sulfotelmatobacter sp.]